MAKAEGSGTGSAVPVYTFVTSKLIVFIDDCVNNTEVIGVDDVNPTNFKVPFAKGRATTSPVLNVAVSDAPLVM